MTDSLLELADAKFVRLTTFRKTGVPVDTPVWVARDGDRLLVMTTGTTGKVKRLRHTSRVVLVPCSRTGAVPDGATTVDAHAEVRGDSATLERLDAVLSKKYGFYYRIARLVMGRSAKAGQRVALVITPPPA